ncbi:Tad domain-containing protein [Paractinoplanes rishiriensis]|uniref:Putative Flp pilus-assembly TadG-like N-terminal domain-containing protein n=1 Tax=Paractinoplanes rishiriensis TaxID=1050105 RepID=A0A919MU74_9ACTN|nr:Tad domain-containing protein [Actinoplanes rishiriensis]GIF00042.1 hypothetical protein Ari01nite_75060 [Actinoplanes rishiriensis]
MLRRIAALGRRRAGSDHGGVAAILAVLLSGGVVLGMSALVIDLGQLYVEREQLQSGADAASMKVALNCANNSISCSSALQSPVAVAYAKKNAKDGQADAQICLSGTTCPTWNTAVTCKPLRTPAPGQSIGNWVEVRTTTVTSTGSTLFPPTFAGALAGGNYKGKQVGTCARVNWGPPAVDKVFALGISMCDWKRMTSNGSTFYGPLDTLLSQAGLYSILGLTKPAVGADSAIPQAAALNALGLPIPSCTTPVIDLTEPRGYVWLHHPDLTPPDSNCMLSLKIGDKPRGFLLSGLTIGNTCVQKLAAVRGGPPILVPIFDEISPALVSLAPEYRVAGFAPFVVTGYTSLLPGVVGAVGSLLSGGLLPAVANILCGLSACIYGYFTRTLVPKAAPVFGTGPNFGATVIGRTG